MAKPQNTLAIILLLAAVIQTQQTPLSSNSAKEEASSTSFRDLIAKLKQLDGISGNQPSREQKQQYSDLMNEYGKMLYYGNTTEVEGSYPKAHAFFKLAAEEGNVESHYYLALLTFFQLDGSFIMQTNFNSYYKNQHAFLRDYVRKANVTKTALHIYLASIQNHLQSSLVLANFYMQGVVMDKKCTSAALYFKKVADHLFSEDQWEDNYRPIFVEKRRLDKEYFQIFNLEKDEDQHFTDSLEELEYMRMSADRGKVSYILQMAYVYLYGLRGQERDYQKAREYFQRAAKLGDSSAKTYIGEMYLRGLGVEVNYTKARQLINEAALKNYGRAKNALGYMYMNGLGVKEDKKEALKYFLDAANASVSDAQYNYGALLQNYSQHEGNQQKNRQMVLSFLNSHLLPCLNQKGQTYINAAALQGNLIAQYHLGLAYLEGTDTYYSCDLATKLLSAACERGSWSEMLRIAHNAFKAKNYRLALSIYLEAAFLGYETAYVNAAIILDKFYPFKLIDISYQTITEILSDDPIFQTLQQSINFKPPTNFKKFLYSDYLSAIRDYQNDQDRIDVLDNLLNVNHTANFTDLLTGVTKMMLYQKMAAENDVFSMFRIAESYRLGDFLPQNYTLAFEHYAQMILTLKGTITKQDDKAYVYSQAYYFMAYMRHYGIGVEKNLTKAIINYNNSIILNEHSGLLARFRMKLAQLELADSKLFPLYNLLNYFTEQGNVTLEGLFRSSFNAKAFEDIPFYLLLVCLVGLVVLKMRLKNYIEIYLTEHKN